MSGPFGSSQWMYSSGGFYPYQIEQSLRFNDDDSAYLSKLWGSAGNKKTFTYSFWIKRANIGSRMDFISFQQDVPIIFNSDTIRVFLFGSDRLITSAQFRDVSAWYHIVLTVDSTDATSGDRIKLYVNGKRQTDFSTESYPSLNADANIYTSGLNQYIGRLYGGSNYFDGYVADMYYLDGIAEDATSFGEFKSGIWVPKAYSGSYGTNGFYLSFADSSAIGDDLSGNGNDWTANNLVSTDVLLDSPTNNFATFNATEPNLMSGGSASLSQGNLQSADAGTSYGLHTRGTFWVSSGKHYCEVLAQSLGGTFSNIGIVKEDKTGVFYQNTGFRNPTAANGGITSYGASYAAGDIIGIGLDLDAGEVTFYKNNVSQGAVTGLSGSYTIGVGDGANASQYVYVANFGQDSSFAGNKTPQGNTDDNGVGDFYYAPPSGFLALCTANLPDPAIDPAQDDVPADYFNTVLYTGDATYPRAITGVGFQPDMVFYKSRSISGAPAIYDAVRGAGAGKMLSTNQSSAEGFDTPYTDTDYGYVSSFDSDGFSIDDGAVSGGWVNNSGTTYVAWNWLAGNGTSSNTDGTITSTVSVNQKAGFSVVGYTGTGANATVGHGLGVAPKMIIFRNRTDAENWLVYTSEFGYQYDIFLDLTNAIRLLDIYYQGDPTSTTFSLKNQNRVNGSGDEHIAYCFAEVEGYSKFSSFVGNGSTDGPFVHCGFRPAFVMVKRVDSGNDWVILDTQRDPYNLSRKSLFPNSSSSETANGFYDSDILSNGFKIRSSNAAINANGGTYILATFAETSVKYANAR